MIGPAGIALPASYSLMIDCFSFTAVAKAAWLKFKHFLLWIVTIPFFFR